MSTEEELSMQVYRNPAPELWPELLTRPVQDYTSILEKVAPVMKAIKEEGIVALKRFTEQFDGVKLNDVWVSEKELDASESLVPEALKRAIAQARINIEKFHLTQREEVKKTETMPGVWCWRRSVPIDRVGLYIPGGSAPLFSTLLMLGVPANIAGCEHMVLATPPNKQGEIHPAILYTAKSLGIKKILKAGGAQAIAALAFGLEGCAPVYKIYGPGNQYVTAAKQWVQAQGIAIDMPAGPSEVAVLADESANPAFIAADLLSQAEHGPDSQVMLVLLSDALLPSIELEIEKQLNDLPRKETAAKALGNSRIVVMSELSKAMSFLNAYAPEHLILQVKELEKAAAMVANAGSVFMGHYTPESAGDYASGTNHTLPTNGYARAYSGVSLDSFCKKITFQTITPEGLRSIGTTIETMAEAEELHAHKNAVSIRMKSL
ncbi:MAG: histidinol dehydrogenase [Cytophagaceae bacterium]|jgi:histidinol dehydrogenase|nr:histidinol dehydrogenase [Cytophagaceae bacterium]